MAALLTGDPEAAAAAFRDELRLCRELVARLYARMGILGLAAVAALDGDVHRASRLTGAAIAHAYGEPENPDEARVDATIIQPGRARAGADAWDAAAREGAALSFEDAIDYALQEEVG
jgi:hypothetical protein